MSERANPFSITVCNLILLLNDTSSEFHQALSSKSTSILSFGDLTAFLQNIVLSNKPPIAIGLSVSDSTQTPNAPYSHNPIAPLNDKDNAPYGQYPRQGMSTGQHASTIFFSLSHFLNQLSMKEQKYNFENKQTKSVTSNGEKSVLSVFYKSLKESASSIDSLIDLLSDIRQIIRDGAIDKNSAQGVYIRKICLGFDQLPFEAITKLWTSFYQYVEEGFTFFQSLLTNQPASIVHPTKKNIFYKSNQNANHHQLWKPSSKQVERLIYQKCVEFDQNVGKKNHSFEQVEGEIQCIMAQHPELPALHFLRFLNCLHHKEHVGAIDSLHRYFDYSMIHERREAMAMMTAVASSSSNPTLPSSANGSNDIINTNNDARTSVVQYAAILLAALHYEFGNDFLSTKATEEAIRVAQQSGDTACVAYALAWLHHSSTNAPPSNFHYSVDKPWLEPSNDSVSRQQAEELLRRCSNLALEQDLNYLVSGAYLALVRHYSTFSYNGKNIHVSCSNYNYHPKDIWKNLKNSYTRLGRTVGKSSHLMNRSASSNRQENSLNVSTIANESKFISKHESLKESFAVLSRQQLVASGVWETFGHTSLGALSAVSALHCYGNYLSTSEFTIAVHKIVMNVLNGNSFHLNPFKFQQTGDFPSAQIHVKNKDNENFDKLQNRGRKIRKESSSNNLCVYAAAIKQLFLIRDKYGIDMASPSNNIWTHSTLLLLHEWALNRGEINHVYALSTLLQTTSPISQQHNIEASVQSLSQHVLMLCHKGLWNDAIRQTKHLCVTCQNHGLRFHHARLLLQLTLIHLQSNSKCISTIITCSLPPLLECISLCDNFSIDSLHAAALSLLAKIYLLLDNPKKAKIMLKATMPSLVQHAPLCVQGEAWVTLGKCYMRELVVFCTKNQKLLTSTESKGGKFIRVSFLANPVSKRIFTKTYSHLKEAIKVFTKIQHIKSLRECYYLMARLCYSCGDDGKKMKERTNKALQGYREACQHLVISSSWPVTFDAFLGILDKNEMDILLYR